MVDASVGASDATEFLHALRRLLHGGEVTEDRVAQVRLYFADLRITRYPHTLLADRIWELRHDVTAYDAAFVVLAELLGASLVTVDARLGRASLPSALVEVF